MDNNNFAVAELNGDCENFFDLEAASCNTPPAQQAHTVDDGKWNHSMPLTESEIEYILTMRASNAQNPDPSYSLAPAELNTNFVGFEELGAHGAWFNYDGAGIPSSANLSDFDIADYGISPPNKEPHFKEPGDVLGALNNFAPNPTDQLENAPTNHNMNLDINTRIALSPVQTQGSVVQPHNVEQIVEPWSIGSKCTWPNCTSRAEFKTKASFRMHVINIHTNPLLCSAAGCPHEKPFGRLSDLRRHEQSAHSSERKFVCTSPSCDALVKEFARKDHLSKHMRERHDHYFCPKFHCPRSTKSSFAKPEDVEEHIKIEHGPYECALLACAQAPSSGFSNVSLRSHLRNHHSVDIWAAYVVAYYKMGGISEAFTEADFPRAHFGECKICKKRHTVNMD